MRNLMTGLEMCELIVKWLEHETGQRWTPREIWEADPNGDLFHVFDWYHYACEYFEQLGHA